MIHLFSILLLAGFDEKDVEAAEREEEEARAMQKRLVEQLDEGDFSLDMFAKVFCIIIRYNTLFKLVCCLNQSP
jgi:hypothetical protein